MTTYLIRKYVTVETEYRYKSELAETFEVEGWDEYLKFCLRVRGTYSGSCTKQEMLDSFEKDYKSNMPHYRNTGRDGVGYEVSPVFNYRMYMSVPVICTLTYNPDELRWEAAFFALNKEHLYTAWYFDKHGINKPSAGQIWKDCKDDLIHEIWLD